MSRPAIAAGFAFAIAAGMAVIFFALDFFSDDPSSTAALEFPVFDIYAALAIGVIALVDWVVRRPRGKG